MDSGVANPPHHQLHFILAPSIPKMVGNSNFQDEQWTKTILNTWGQIWMNPDHSSLAYTIKQNAEWCQRSSVHSLWHVTMDPCTPNKTMVILIHCQLNKPGYSLITTLFFDLKPENIQFANPSEEKFGCFQVSGQKTLNLNIQNQNLMIPNLNIKKHGLLPPKHPTFGSRMDSPKNIQVPGQENFANFDSAKCSFLVYLYLHLGKL